MSTLRIIASHPLAARLGWVTSEGTVWGNPLHPTWRVVDHGCWQQWLAPPILPRSVLVTVGGLQKRYAVYSTQLLAPYMIYVIYHTRRTCNICPLYNCVRILACTLVCSACFRPQSTHHCMELLSTACNTCRHSNVQPTAWSGACNTDTRHSSALQ